MHAPNKDFERGTCSVGRKRNLQNFTKSLRNFTVICGTRLYIQTSCALFMTKAFVRGWTQTDVKVAPVLCTIFLLPLPPPSPPDIPSPYTLAFTPEPHVTQTTGCVTANPQQNTHISPTHNYHYTLCHFTAFISTLVVHKDYTYAISCQVSRISVFP